MSPFGFVPREDYLHVRVPPELAEAECRALLGRIRAECRAHSVTRVLVDATELRTWFSMTALYTLGEFAARKMSRPRLKVASVVAESSLPSRGFFETVCRNQGGWYRRFEDPEEAHRWLQGENN